MHKVIHIIKSNYAFTYNSGIPYYFSFSYTSNNADTLLKGMESSKQKGQLSRHAYLIASKPVTKHMYNTTIDSSGKYIDSSRIKVRYINGHIMYFFIYIYI